MSVEFRIISIGTLSHNRLWGETTAVRTAHATTTLVEHDKRLILVDPGLPAQALEARFNERTGRRLSDVTDIFCTSIRRAHIRALPAMTGAAWWAGETEIAARRQDLAETIQSARRLDPEDADSLQNELKALERFRPADDRLTSQVSLYPLAGPSPGCCGLLLTPLTQTILVAGDAALTADHVLAGQIWEGSTDRDSAMDSLRDLLELADLIVPGHDNIMVSPNKWMGA